MTMSSTLVETVSINFEDFNESFLTCGTCLCMYDGGEHTPKLLPCSHTVCRQCLERIVAAATLQSREAGTFRCPICRETIVLPRGGVNALPPSFLVNQLLDLMLSQRREVIPKCATHPTQELLFCETCDVVFCTLCTNGSHGNGGSSTITTPILGGNNIDEDGTSHIAPLGEHTVIPFSIAIKRMSEILLYKAHQCISKLGKAADNMTEEIHKLDHNADHAFECVNKSFQDVIDLVERRRQEVMNLVRRLRDEKKQVLQEQLELIQSERERVESECEGLQYQVEVPVQSLTPQRTEVFKVRNITKKISDLNAKLDAVSALHEPRENAFIRYEFGDNAVVAEVQTALSKLGRVCISKTFPALCTAVLETAVVHLKIQAVVTTIDYHGDLVTTGGDPVEAELRHENGDLSPTDIIDKEDGSYVITYTPQMPGQYKLHITIFDRPIKGSPFKFEAQSHINPLTIFGSKGSGSDNLLQPVSVALDKAGHIYVTDTGNSRIKVLSPAGRFQKHLGGDGLEERSGTGVTITPDDTLIIVNWRTRSLTEMSLDGQVLKQFSHPDLREPISVAVNSKKEIHVADNGVSCVFVFDASGKLLRKVGTKGSVPTGFGLISSVSIGRDDEVLVTDSRILVFAREGEFLREIYAEAKGKGKHGGVVYDPSTELLLATYSSKSGSTVQVFSYEGQLLFCIDSQDAKLKRPCGLAVTSNHQVVVVDLGNDCVKIYRYQ